MYAGNIVQFINNDIDAVKRAQEEEEFLTLLGEAEQKGWHLSHDWTTRNYAPRVFSCNHDKRMVYEEAMKRLFKQQRIHAETYGRQHWERVRITRSEAEVVDFTGNCNPA